MYRRGTIGEQLTGAGILFLLFVIIALGIVAGKFLFYGQDFDFRKADAAVLHERLRACIVGTRVLDGFGVDWNVDDFFELCRLNRKVIEEYFLVLIEVDGSVVYSWKGDRVSCALGEKNERYPSCVGSSFVKEIDGESKKVYLLTGSDQRIRRKLS